MKNKKRSKLLLVILIVLVTIGFALLTATLKINFSGSFSRGVWDIHWDKVQNESGVSPVNKATIDPSDNRRVSFEVEFDKPGDYYEFTVDAVNTGTIDGMLKSITTTINGTSIDNISNYLDYTIAYADGTSYAENDLLAAGQQITYRVRLQYKENITEAQLEAIPTGGEPITADIELNYDQADNNAVDKGNTSLYYIFKVGDYFEMLPDKDQATTTIAGFDGSTLTEYQKLWRVIKLNADGSMDAVSEYTSRSTIKVFTVDGFTNMVAGMQDIASCYAKKGYTVGTRMMGYNGQTAVISDTFHYDGTINPRDNSDISPPARANTPHPLTGTGEEYMGGVIGDTLYLRDVQLVANVFKTEPNRYGETGLKATSDTSNTSGNINSGYDYWLASRGYRYNSNWTCFDGNAISKYGEMYEYCIRSWFNGQWQSGASGSYRVRPIITLASTVKRNTGEGTRVNPYTLK